MYAARDPKPEFAGRVLAAIAATTPNGATRTTLNNRKVIKAVMAVIFRQNISSH